MSKSFSNLFQGTGGASVKVWDDITPTQPCYQGEEIPQSFTIKADNETLCEHATATRHLQDDVIKQTNKRLRSALEKAKLKKGDIVRLKTEFKGLPVGTIGIVLEYEGTDYLVEFFDAEGQTIAVYTTPPDVLELVSTP